MTWKIRSINQIDVDAYNGQPVYAYYLRMCCNGLRPQLVADYAAFKIPSTPALHKVETYASEAEAQAVIDAMPPPYNTILMPVDEQLQCYNKPALAGFFLYVRLNINLTKVISNVGFYNLFSHRRIFLILDCFLGFNGYTE